MNSEIPSNIEHGWKLIGECRNLLKLINDDTKELKDLKLLINTMEGNDDFITFVEGSNIGSELYDDWESLVDLVTGDLYDRLTTLNNNTYKYLKNFESVIKPYKEFSESGK